MQIDGFERWREHTVFFPSLIAKSMFGMIITYELPFSIHDKTTNVSAVVILQRKIKLQNGQG